MQAKDEERGSKGTSEGRKPGADRYLGTGQRRKRGGKQTREGSHRIAQVTPWGRPERKGSADERWRPLGSGAIHVDGLSAPGQVGGKN